MATATDRQQLNQDAQKVGVALGTLFAVSLFFMLAFGILHDRWSWVPAWNYLESLVLVEVLHFFLAKVGGK